MCFLPFSSFSLHLLHVLLQLCQVKSAKMWSSNGCVLCQLLSHLALKKKTKKRRKQNITMKIPTSNSNSKVNNSGNVSNNTWTPDRSFVKWHTYLEASSTPAVKRYDIHIDTYFSYFMLYPPDLSQPLTATSSDDNDS